MMLKFLTPRKKHPKKFIEYVELLHCTSGKHGKIRRTRDNKNSREGELKQKVKSLKRTRKLTADVMEPLL